MSSNVVPMNSDFDSSAMEFDNNLFNSSVVMSFMNAFSKYSRDPSASLFFNFCLEEGHPLNFS